MTGCLLEICGAAVGRKSNCRGCIWLQGAAVDEYCMLAPPRGIVSSRLLKRGRFQSKRRGSIWFVTFHSPNWRPSSANMKNCS